jgi:hypothetical protein
VRVESKFGRGYTELGNGNAPVGLQVMAEVRRVVPNGLNPI